MGCHNINLVTPTHYVPNIVQALRFAVGGGLRVRWSTTRAAMIRWTCCACSMGSWTSICQILSTWTGAAAGNYFAGANDYPEVAAAAIQEMYRQVGNLVTDEDGIAVRGVMIRHLVLPHNLAGTDRFVCFAAARLGPPPM
jgi:putative pyruvate formate lyase activating enzyme